MNQRLLTDLCVHQPANQNSGLWTYLMEYYVMWLVLHWGRRSSTAASCGGSECMKHVWSVTQPPLNITVSSLGKHPQCTAPPLAASTTRGRVKTLTAPWWAEANPHTSSPFTHPPCFYSALREPTQDTITATVFDFWWSRDFPVHIVDHLLKFHVGTAIKVNTA